MCRKESLWICLPVEKEDDTVGLPMGLAYPSDPSILSLTLPLWSLDLSPMAACKSMHDSQSAAGRASYRRAILSSCLLAQHNISSSIRVWCMPMGLIPLHPMIIVIPLLSGIEASPLGPFCLTS